MKHFSPILLLALFVGCVPPTYATDPPAPPPAPAVHLPEQPPAPNPPTPTPVPMPVTKLSAGQLYTVSADVPFLLVASRQGLVKVSVLQAPITIFGSFVDQKPGDENGRTYAKGTVEVVQAAGVGQVELIIATDLTGANLLRRTLDVDNGAPKPPDPPGPKPPDPPAPTDPLTAALQTAYQKEADPAKAAKVQYLGSVYRSMSLTLPSTVRTPADLFAALAAAIHDPTAGFAKGDIPGVMNVVGTELNSAVGTEPAKAMDLAAVKAELAKIGTALSKAGGN